MKLTDSAALTEIAATVDVLDGAYVDEPHVFASHPMIDICSQCGRDQDHLIHQVPDSKRKWTEEEARQLFASTPQALVLIAALDQERERVAKLEAAIKELAERLL